MLFEAWRYGNESPYRLYNNLDENFIPLRGDDDPHRPPYPSRARAFIYGCAEVAQEDALKLAGVSVRRQMAAGAGAVRH